MRLLPRTLGGRTLLLVIVTVLISEAATFFVLGRFRQTYIAQRGADTIVGHVRVIQSAIEAMPPAGRARFAQAAAVGAERVRVEADARVQAPRSEPMSRLRREMAEHIRADLGDATDVRSLRSEHGPPHELWVSFGAGGERWWLVVPSGRLEMPLPWPLIAVLGAVTAAAMVFGALIVRSIVRPLHDLEDATEALGAGRPRPVAPAGPQETRVLAQRFNAMLDQLDAAERERNVMLAGLPHDLRAPLTRLRLRLAMLDPQLTEGIQRDAEDIDRIANQFIAYLRGAGRSEEAREPIPLLAFAEERVEHYRQLGRDVSARGDASVRVRADAEALARVLDNLIDNALRYGAEPVEVQVSGDHLAQLTVRDHGAGIAGDEIERARQPFTRLDSARTGGGHCGLGLAIVDRIARRHGGVLVLANAAGGGLEARVTLEREGAAERARAHT